MRTAVAAGAGLCAAVGAMYAWKRGVAASRRPLLLGCGAGVVAAAYLAWSSSSGSSGRQQLAAPATPDTPARPPSQLFVLHSGGPAAAVAERIAQSAPGRFRLVHTADFAQWAAEFSLTEAEVSLHGTLAVFVVSTLANEQPPEAAGACVRFFNRRTHADRMLHGLAYAVLGLGDSSLHVQSPGGQRKCNQVATRLAARMAALGARRFHRTGEVDARSGDEELEPWLRGLVEALEGLDALPGG